MLCAELTSYNKALCSVCVCVCAWVASVCVILELVALHHVITQDISACHEISFIISIPPDIAEFEFKQDVRFCEKLFFFCSLCVLYMHCVEA